LPRTPVARICSLSAADHQRTGVSTHWPWDHPCCPTEACEPHIDHRLGRPARLARSADLRHPGDRPRSSAVHPAEYR